ncbi:MAG: DUF115 domain-containing protein [Lachnospiraceae bacterium]|nr:DUF115 domain-containing protein [Lachnospiraceae bacterium]
MENKDFFCINYNGKEYCMQSRVDMDYAISVWLQQFKDIDKKSVFIIFGFGHKGYIERLSEQYKDNRIIVYEPDSDVIKSQYNDIALFTNVTVATGADGKMQYLSALENTVDFLNKSFLQIASIPNYVNIFKEEYVLFKNYIKMVIEQVLVSKNTVINDEKIRGRAYIYNMMKISETTSFLEMYEEFKNCDFSNYSAVVVSAGPSLDKNVKELKKYKGKVFILCCDGAIRTLLENDIVPDMTICVDPGKNPESFATPEAAAIPMFISPQTNYELSRKITGRKFMIKTRERTLIDAIYEYYGKELFAAPTGGSVANTAFTLVRVLGFGKIVLIGQDLAFSEGKLHSDAYAEDTIKEEVFAKPDIEYVEGINGDKVLSDGLFKLYREWFEKQCELYPDTVIIDASEGGALIKGTKIMTLKEALSMSDQNETIDFEEMVASVPYSFADEQKKQVDEFLDSVVKSVSKICDEIKRELNNYDDLDRIIRNNVPNQKELKKVLEKVMAYLTKLENYPANTLFNMFENKQDYEIMEELAGRESNSNNDMLKEVRLLAKTGRATLERYLASGKTFKEQWDIVWNS